jgi:uncharacterized membrane-anchored protein YitT (DUF2179 family)
MESLIESTWYFILFLIEIGIVLLLFDGIMWIICTMFGLSWKKVLMWAAAIFGILWIRDYLKNRKEKAKKEIVQDLTEEDFEVVNEGE